MNGIAHTTESTQSQSEIEACIEMSRRGTQGFSVDRYGRDIS